MTNPTPESRAVAEAREVPGRNAVEKALNTLDLAIRTDPYDDEAWDRIVDAQEALVAAVRAEERARVKALAEGLRAEMLSECTERDRYGNDCPFCRERLECLDRLLAAIDGRE